MRRGCASGVLILLAVTTLSAIGAATADAQVRGRGGRRPPTPPRTERPTTPGADSAKADSTRRELVKWAEEDSVMQDLSGRTGFDITRYQGETVNFDATGRVLTLQGDSAAGTPAAVQRGQSLIVGLRVLYNDSLQLVRATGNPAIGDTVVLRDPTQGSDVVAIGYVEYDMGTRRALVSNISTEVTSGETWHVSGARGAYLSDSTGQGDKAFYVRNGSITSCDDPVPDYHFEAKEIKLVAKKVLVARPAVLYIADVPVMVLPFIFQDLRSGRRSGLLTPRFGVSELLRNNPSYHRHFENFGYYFALNDFMDAQAAVDWYSSAGTGADVGWIRYNGEWRYRWLNRFLTGRFATSYMRQGNGLRNTSFSWVHDQEFSSTSRLSANVNYVTNTTVQRNTTINPYQALATIQSQLNYSRKIGPFSMQAGGTRRQFPGRQEVDQTLPQLSLMSGPLNLASWLVWTPSLNVSNQQNLKMDQSGAAAYSYFLRGGGELDSTRQLPSRRATTVSLGTPIKIFGFDWSNSFAINDRESTIPTRYAIDAVVTGPDGLPLKDSQGRDSVAKSNRLYGRTYQTDVDWITGISLPSLSQGKWNFTPSVSIVNVDPGAYWVRSQFTGGTFVHQSKRLQYGVSASPTFFGLFPGFGPVTRFRHAISPVLRFDYAPEARVSDEYLNAVGSSRSDYLGSLQNNRVSLGLSTNLEAKLKQPADSGALNTDSQYGGGQKLKIVSIRFSDVAYDFAKLRELRRRAADPIRYPNAPKVNGFAGLQSDRFDMSFSSDLLPGFTLNTSHSLFKGSTLSDTAVFKPYLENVSATLSLNQNSGIFAAFARIFGRAVPARPPGTAQAEQIAQTRQDAIADQVLSQPVAGSEARNAQFNVPSGRGWQGSFTFTSQRPRPVSGTNVVDVDPAVICEQYRTIPATFNLCRANPVTFGAANGGIDPNSNTIGRNGTIYRTPPQTNLGSNMSFDITPHWSAAWSTQYDFRGKDFASQIVTLQRELHDWRAIFGFTKGPNGSFAFTFFISLNAQPDLKFDYDRRSYRQQNTIP